MHGGQIELVKIFIFARVQKGVCDSVFYIGDRNVDC